MRTLFSDNFNGDYYLADDPHTGEANVSELRLPIQWQAAWVWSKDSPAGIHVRPEFGYREVPDGSAREGRSAAVHVSDATMDAVLFHIVETMKGSQLSLMVDVMGAAGDGAQHGIRIGIDPYGGINPDSDKVVWGEWYSQEGDSVALWINHAWLTLTASCLARGTHATIFLRSVNSYKVDCAAHWDTLVLQDDYDGAEPEPTNGSFAAIRILVAQSMENLIAIHDELDAIEARSVRAIIIGE